MFARRCTAHLRATNLVPSHRIGAAVSSSIYKSAEGRAEILRLYDEALDSLGDHASRRVQTRYGETHVLALGPEDAPPLVFLPGGNFLNPTCLRWFAPLAERFRVYAPDIVGQPGRSAQARPSPKGEGHAWWVEDVLDGLSLDRAPLVGLSYGAGVAIRTAGYAPERVSKAALVSPAGIVSGPVRPMILEVAVPMIAYRLAPNDERLLRAAEPILTEPDDLATRQLGAVYRHVRLDAGLPRMASREELSRFDAPVAVFACEGDVFFPGAAVVERAARIFRNLAGAVCLPGCRHVPSAGAFRRINREIRTFLERAENS
jgi:pimeloyl-ACP methyl ester carboxylesterase